MTKNLFDVYFTAFIRKKSIIGLSLFLFGFPLNYLLRDGLRLAPSSSIFTQAFLFFSLLLMIPLDHYKRLYKPDNRLTLIVVLFHVICFVYLWIYHASHVNVGTEIIYLSINMIFLFLLSFLSLAELEENGFLNFLIYLIIIQNVGVLAISLLGGNFQLGGRLNLAVVNKTGEVEGVTNPHIFAKSAYTGLLIVLSCLKFKLKSVSKIALFIATVSSILVLAFTFSMATILSILLFAFFLILFLPKGYILGVFKKQIRKPINIIILGIGLIGSLAFYSAHAKEVDLIVNIFVGRGFKIINTLVVGKYDQNSALETDMSAGTRVETINFMYNNLIDDFESFDLLRLIFGHGYAFYYLDIPVIQIFQDMGIIGFIIFISWHLLAFLNIRKYIRNEYSSVLFFVCGIFFLCTVSNLTQGLPYGYQNWIYMIFITRYLKTFVNKSKEEVPIGSK